MVHDRGLLLALHPEDVLDSYDLFLLNATSLDLVCHGSLLSAGGFSLDIQQKVGPGRAEGLGSMPRDVLNDRPTIRLTSQRLTTAGLEGESTCSRRIKAKVLFGQPTLHPLLDRPAFLLRLHSVNELRARSRAEESLAAYTRREASRKRQSQTNSLPWLDLQRAAQFPTSLDLHADKAFSQSDRMRPEEIFPAQMRLVDRYLADAIRYNLSKVTLIHGKGEGRLRMAIAARLETMAEVRTFRHVHDAGATEVFF